MALGYDFAVLTDHDSDTPMNSRQPAIDYLKSLGVTPDRLNLILGIEADSSGGHFVTFPIQYQDHYDNIYDTVTNYHKQGAVVIWAHPLLTYTSDVKYDFEHFDEIGLDGFEIVNSGFFGNEEGGIGEFALNHPFTGASDAHSTGALRRTENYVFATDVGYESIQNAILSRRNVVYARYNANGDTVNFFTGDTNWLNELYRRNETANMALKDYSALLTSLASSGLNLDKANQYLSDSMGNQSLRNIQRVTDNIRLGLLDLYPTTISLADSNIQTGSDVTFDVSMVDQQQNSVSNANMNFKLFDGSGNLIDQASDAVSSTQFQQKFSIPLTSDEGQYFLWTNVSINGAFFENRILFNVTKGTETTTSTSSTTTTSSTTPTTSTKSKAAGNSEVFMLGSALMCLVILKKKGLKNK